jgi:hypothetical protein
VMFFLEKLIPSSMQITYSNQTATWYYDAWLRNCYMSVTIRVCFFFKKNASLCLTKQKTRVKFVYNLRSDYPLRVSLRHIVFFYVLRITESYSCYSVSDEAHSATNGGCDFLESRSPTLTPYKV